MAEAAKLWIRRQGERLALLGRAARPSDHDAREIIAASLRRRLLRRWLTDDDGVRLSHEIGTERYQEWIRRFDELSWRDKEAILGHIADAELPVPHAVFVFSAATAPFARATVQYLRKQLLSRFDALLYFSPDCPEEAVAATRRAVKGDPRFTLSGPLHLYDQDFFAERDFVLLAEGGVFLREHALYMFLLAAQGREPCLIYADEDHIDAHGIRRRPRFKPSFSPELLRHTGYIGPCVFLRGIRLSGNHFPFKSGPGTVGCVIEALVEEAGGDAVLQVPFVLYHDARGPQPPRVQQDDHRLVGQELPSVSMIIPTKDRLDLLEPCLTSIETGTRYPRAKLEVVVIDNGSADPATLSYLRQTAKRGAIRLLRDETPFNYSRLNNIAARQSTGEVLVFLNNDTVVNDPRWLELLVVQAMQEDVGAVGAKLLYPDETVQFGGTIVGLQGVAGHAHVGLQTNDGGYCGIANVTREVGAVTGACLAIRRKVFDDVGGFDTALAVGCNDVLLCCELLARGYRNLCVAPALLIHRELQSRGGDDTQEKIERAIAEGCYLRSRHKRLFQNDPYYNPNLSYERPYDIAFPPRREKPWWKYGRRRGNVRVLMLSNLDRTIEDEPAIMDLQAVHLARRGHEVFVGSPHVRPGMSHQGCKFVRLGHPIEAAAYAVANDIDCIIVHSSPFFSVVRWIGDWPRCILCDYGEPEAFIEDQGIRRRQEVERQFCLGVADRVFAIPEVWGERVRRGDLARGGPLDEFAAMVEAACRS